MSKVSQVTAKLTGTEDPMPEGRCWLWHRWTKWVDSESVLNYHGAAVVAKGLLQTRYCSVCNRVNKRIEWTK